MVWAFVMFFALELDRSNLSQANADNLLQDLGLTTNDFNLGNTLFKLCFLSAELPSQLISKRLGPDIWIPTQMCLWSTVAFSQFWMKGRASFLTCRYAHIPDIPTLPLIESRRCLLGFMQGGFIPDVILYLSFFYTKTECKRRSVIRLTFLSHSLQCQYASRGSGSLTTPLTLHPLCSQLASYGCAVSQVLLVSGRGTISSAPSVDYSTGWRWLFLLEGLFTLIIGFTSYFLMPPGPTQTRARWRPEGWFNERCG